jgi:hypothetical protein
MKPFRDKRQSESHDAIDELKQTLDCRAIVWKRSAAPTKGEKTDCEVSSRNCGHNTSNQGVQKFVKKENAARFERQSHILQW